MLIIQSKNNLNFIYCDHDIAIINKPSGLLSVPGKGIKNFDSVETRLKNYFPNIISQPAVHRLDQHTSGILVLALNKPAHKNLSVQFQNHQIEKKYIAILNGFIEKKSGKIELPFRLDLQNRPKQIYDSEKGKPGITVWEKIGDLQIKENCKKKYSKILFTPITGRTHQLRLHASHRLGLGTAIIGDSLYGAEKQSDKLFLHSFFISFIHPATNKKISFFSEPDF